MWVWSGSLQLGREGEVMIPRWNPDCDSQLGALIPAHLHCRSWWSCPQGEGSPLGQGRGVGWVVPAAFLSPATYPCSPGQQPALLLFPPADLGDEQEGKRAALGTVHPARREWPAQPFPVLRGFSRELFPGSLPCGSRRLLGSRFPHPSAAPGANKGVPKSGIKTSVAVTL